MSAMPFARKIRNAIVACVAISTVWGWTSVCAEISGFVSPAAVSKLIGSDAVLLQNCADTLRNGDTLRLEPGAVFYLDRPVRFRSLTNVVIEGNGATLVQGFPGAGPVQLVDCDNLRVRDLRCEGNESLESYFPRERKEFVNIIAGRGVRLENLFFTNKTASIKLEFAKDCVIDHCDSAGFFESNPSFEIWRTGAIVMLGGGGHLISGCSTWNHAAAVLGGDTTVSNTIVNCRATNVWDNGFYISSGDYNVVSNCVIINGAGSGVKLRGSGNQAVNSIASNTLSGFQLTGYVRNNFSPFSGTNSAVLGCSAYSTANRGIGIGIIQGFEMSGCRIQNNLLWKCGANKFPSIVLSGESNLVDGNIIVEGLGFLRLNPKGLPPGELPSD